jgi:16S rRNA (guanine966-N2)-methyltransferase
MPRGSGRGLRVIAGEAGGRRLAAPRGERTRPTADRVKESVFAALDQDRVAGAAVLDAFAGSGALAIEALSRGAARAVLVDRDPAAADAIRRNLRTTGFGARASVQRRAVGAFLRGAPPAEAPFDLVFLDPPYDQADSELAAVLSALGAPGWLAPGALVVLERAEAAGPPPLPADWMVNWQRAYGDTLVVVATAAAARP